MTLLLGETPGAARTEPAAAEVGAAGGKPPPSLLRFSAHLLLFLQLLIPDGGGLQPGGTLYFHLNKVGRCRLKPVFAYTE
jgi:hypothetical protein